MNFKKKNKTWQRQFHDNCKTFSEGTVFAHSANRKTVQCVISWTEWHWCTAGRSSKLINKTGAALLLNMQGLIRHCTGAVTWSCCCSCQTTDARILSHFYTQPPNDQHVTALWSEWRADVMTTDRFRFLWYSSQPEVSCCFAVKHWR